MRKYRLPLFALTLIALSFCNSEPPKPVAETPDEPVVETKAQPSGYALESGETDISFVIVSNSAGPITARFPNGCEGSLDASGVGSFTIQLDTMKSLDQNDLENPLRDDNVIEAFFGVRPSKIFPEPVDKAWALLTDKLERSVAKARFEVSATEGLAALADGGSGAGSMTGNLVLWNKVSTPLVFPVNMTRSGDHLEMTSTAPASLDLERVLGPDLRKLIFDTMLAAGCAHQPGIQNTVEINLHKVVFHAQ